MRFMCQQACVSDNTRFLPWYGCRTQTAHWGKLCTSCINKPATCRSAVTWDGKSSSVRLKTLRQCLWNIYNQVLTNSFRMTDGIHGSAVRLSTKWDFVIGFHQLGKCLRLFYTMLLDDRCQNAVFSQYFKFSERQACQKSVIERGILTLRRINGSSILAQYIYIFNQA